MLKNASLILEAALVSSLRHILASSSPISSKSGTSRSRLRPQDRINLLEGTIFGTDLDARAVEWTRRGLLLALWESCIRDGIDPVTPDLRIPSLQGNIRCADFLAESERPFRPNIILGGPPFVRLSRLHKTQPERIPEYRRKFTVARQGQFDLYMLFLEEALRLLDESGLLAFSLSSSFLRSESGRPLRGFIARHAQVREIVEFEDNRIYPDATTQIALMLLCKDSRKCAARHVLVRGHGRLREKLGHIATLRQPQSDVIETRLLPVDALSLENWRLTSAEQRAGGNGGPPGLASLEDAPVEIRRGLSTGADDVFLLESLSHEYSGTMLVRRQRGGKSFHIEAAALRPILRGRDIRAYSPPATTTMCVYPYDDCCRPLAQDELRDRYPMAYRHLTAHRTRLEKRLSPSGDRWHLFHTNPSPRSTVSPRIVGARINSGKGFTIDATQNTLCASSVLTVLPGNGGVDPYFLLGILNSQTFAQFMQDRAPNLGVGRTVYPTAWIRRFPLIRADSRRMTVQSEAVAQRATRLLDRGLPAKERDALKRQVDEIVRAIYEASEAEV